MNKPIGPKMSKMADLMLDIEDMYYDGLNAPEVAKRLKVPESMVVEEFNRISKELSSEIDGSVV